MRGPPPFWKEPASGVPTSIGTTASRIPAKARYFGTRDNLMLRTETAISQATFSFSVHRGEFRPASEKFTKPRQITVEIAANRAMVVISVQDYPVGTADKILSVWSISVYPDAQYRWPSRSGHHAKSLIAGRFKPTSVH